MPNEFIEGKDWIADPTGNTTLANTIFVSDSGNDANPGTSPDSPKLNISDTGSTQVIGVKSIVIPFNGVRINLLGDGYVIFNGDGVSTAITCSSFTVSLRNIRFNNWFKNIDTVPNTRDSRVIDCLFNGGLNEMNYVKIGGSNFSYSNNKHINCNFSASGSFGNNETDIFTQQFKGNIFIGGSVDLSNAVVVSSRFGFVNSYFDQNTQLIFTPAQLAQDYGNVKNCCIRGTINVVGDQTYANLDAAKVVYPNAFVNCFNDDPLFLGNPAQMEFVVNTNSPLLGAGELGVNIGNVKAGNLQNDISSEFGTSPQLNTNTQFVSGELRVVSGLSGRRESSSIDLGQLFSGITISLNSILDLLNNTPDANNSMVNPNHLVLEIQWAGQDQVFNGTWRKIRPDFPLVIDNNGLSPGDIGFVLFGLSNIQFRYIKVAIEPRQDYNQA